MREDVIERVMELSEPANRKRYRAFLGTQKAEWLTKRLVDLEATRERRGRPGLRLMDRLNRSELREQRA